MIMIFVKASKIWYPQVFDQIKNLADYNTYQLEVCAFDKSKISEYSIVFYEVNNQEDEDDVRLMQREFQNMHIVILYESLKDERKKCNHNIIGYIQYQTMKEDFIKLQEFIYIVFEQIVYSFQYTSSFMSFRINPMNVMYAESYHHDVYIHTKYMKLKVRDTLKNYCLSTRYIKLIQVHKSYIVNVSYIEEIVKEKILLNNNVSLPIREKYKKY